MRGSVSPAVVASLYSLILLSVATIMSRRRSGGGPRSNTSSLFRGTGVSLCVVAFAMPMLRLVGTHAIPDLLLLWATMGASVAVIAFLIRPRQPGSELELAEDADDAEEARRTARENAKRTRAARAARANAERLLADVLAENGVSGQDLDDVTVTPTSPMPPRTPIRADGSTGLARLSVVPSSVVPPRDGPTTERAADALHEVDLVVDDVAGRLGLDERRRR
jgi:hypothetical protein